MRKGSINLRVNEEIRAPELRVIGADGKQVGVVKRDVAISQAKDAGLDLVEIAPQAKPPVAKIVNLGKFIYQEEKKKKESLKKVKGGDVKEIRFSPFIAENDYNTRIERIKEFLAEKNKVKLTVVFKGRQMGSKSFGYNLLGRVIKDFGEKIHIDMEPKFIGRHLIMTISPVTKSAKSKEIKKDAKSEN